MGRIKIEEYLKDLGWNVSTCDRVLTIQRHTPLGEDWFYELPLDNLENKLIELYSNFDVDEEAAFWIERRGENGVPDSVKDLLEDAEWKEKELEKIYDLIMRI